MYSHAPLSPGKTIRILILEPALQMSKPVSCSLKELSLENVDPKKSPYEALSYVWGSPKGDKKLNCNGQPLLVTENCLAALRHLRYRRKSRTLWIDAICIDQSSVKERNHQVRLMGDVYKLARRVLIWLGVGNRDTGRLMRFLTWNSMATESRWKGHLWAGLIRLILIHCMKKELQIGSQPEHFQNAFPAEWYRRVWTLQELLMGHECVITCGRHKLPWNALSGMDQSGFPKSCILPSSINLSFPEIQTAVLARNSLLLAANPKSIHGPGTKRSNLRNSEACLMVLSTTGRRSVSDPRDKVFGIFSILVELGVGIPAPDYSKTVCEVFTEFTLAMITHLQSPSFLTYEDWKFNTAGWPSWVPNLDCSGSLKGGVFNSHLKRFPGSILKYSEGRLSLQGYDHGFIGVVGPECPAPSTEKNLGDFLVWLFRCYSTADSFANILLNKTTMARQTLLCLGASGKILDKVDCFWLKTIAESGLAIHDVKTLYFDKMGLAIQSAASKLDIETCRDIETLWSLLIKHKRKSFVSSKNHFGLGFDIAVDDLLITLVGIGTRQPLSVRPDGDNYRLIGKVYMPASDRDKLEERVETSFTFV